MKKFVAKFNRIVIIIIIVGVFTGGLSNAVNAVYFVEAIRQHSHNENLLFLGNVYEEMEVRLTEIERDVEMLSLLTVNRFRSDDALPDMNKEEAFYEELFNDYLNNDACVAMSIYIYFDPSLDGEVHDVWMNTKSDGSFAREDEIPLERYISRENMSWFYGPKALGVGTWVPPYRNRYDQHITSYVKPIYVGNQFVGIVGMYLSLDKIKDRMEKVIQDSDNIVIITNAKHEVIFGHGFKEGDKWSDLYEIKSMNRDFQEISVDGKDYFEYERINEYGWRILYLVPVAEVVNEVVTGIVFTIMVFLLAALIFVVIISYIIRKYHFTVRGFITAVNNIPKNFVSNNSKMVEKEHEMLSELTKSQKRLKLVERENERLKSTNPITGIKNQMMLRDYISSQDKVHTLIKICFERVSGSREIVPDEDIAFVKKISHVLIGKTTNEIILFHLSNSEFALVLEGVDREFVQAFEGSLRNELYESVVAEGLPLFLCIGVARSNDVKSVDVLLASEIALNIARSKGINQTVYYSERAYQDLMSEFKLKNELTKAIENELIEVVFMPEVDIVNQLVIAVEALVRWKHPLKGQIDPRTFIACAEKYDLMGVMGDKILDYSCRKMKEWKLMKCRVQRLSINLSEYQLLQHDIIERITSIVDRYGIKPKEISFGVNSETLDNLLVIETLKRLREIGFGVTLDNFSSVSSLERMKMIPINRVKIDLELIKMIDVSSERQLIVEALIKIASKLNLPVVAEGVENSEQVEFLLRLGCVTAQGYFFSEPLKSEGVSRFCEVYVSDDEKF